jgi:hypothetical protein
MAHYTPLVLPVIAWSGAFGNDLLPEVFIWGFWPGFKRFFIPIE